MSCTCSRFGEWYARLCCCAGMERDELPETADSFLQDGMTALLQSVSGLQNACRVSVEHAFMLL